MLLRPSFLSQQSNLRPQQQSCQCLKVLGAPLIGRCLRHKKGVPLSNAVTQESAEVRHTMEIHPRHQKLTVNEG
eukprot:681657-Pelagomonas_calceolata.AAC.1